MPPRQREVFIQMSADEQKAVEAFLRVDRSMKGVEQSFEHTSRKGKGFDASLKNISRTASNMLGFLGVGGGVAGLVYAVGQGMEAAAGQSTKFTNEMRELLSLGDNLSNIKAVKEEVLAFSNEWGISTDKVTKGMFLIESGAANLSKAMQRDLMISAAAMTEAFGGELDVNVNALIKTMHSYGEELGSASKAQAKLGTIAEQAYITMAELGTLLPEVMSVSKNLGYSFDALGASLIVATRVGGKNANTFTAWENIVVNMDKAIEAGYTTRQNFIQQFEDLSKVDPQALLKVFGESGGPLLLGIVENLDMLRDSFELMGKAGSDAFGKLEQRLGSAAEKFERDMRKIQTVLDNVTKNSDFAESQAAESFTAHGARNVANKIALSNAPFGLGAFLADWPSVSGGLQSVMSLTQGLTDPVMKHAVVPAIRGVNSFFDTFGGDPRFSSGEDSGLSPLPILDSTQIGRMEAGLDLKGANPNPDKTAYYRFLNERAYVPPPGASQGSGTVINNDNRTTVIQGGNYSSSVDLAQKANGKRAGQAGRL